MRVLFPFVGDTVGGSHHSVALLLSALPSLGIQPVCLIHRRGLLAPFFRANGIESLDDAVGLPVWESEGGGPRNIVRLLALIPRITEALRRYGADVVHVNDARMAITWGVPSRLLGIPLVVHQRTRLVPSRISQLALASATAIVAISEFTRQSLPARMLPRTNVVANPFSSPRVGDRSAARAALRERFGLPHERPIIAVVGTIQAQKRQTVAVEVLAALHDRGFVATLLLVGRAEGFEVGAVRDLVVKNGLQDWVKILGYQAEMEDFWAGCDLLLAPAVNEGHGRAVVEAMLAGVPVIASSSGGHIEIVHDSVTGVLVKADDVNEMTTAAAELLFLRPDTASALAGRAREWALSRFSVNAHAEAIAAIYRTVVPECG
ncbi:MAG: glycosyltransferase family 4 protein [Thermodesulfobacteriota bacterium]